MWDGKKSIMLSRVCVLVFLLLLIAAAVSAPWMIHRLLSISRAELQGKELLFGLTLYSGAVPAALLLTELLLLLRRMEAQSVFTVKNVACLRVISWCCFAGAAVCVLSGFYYLPWAALGVAAAFMGLIVRVVKNVFARAVDLQDDADFTV